MSEPDSDAMLCDDEPEMLELVQEAMQIDERFPPPPLSPRKPRLNMQPASASSGARRKVLDEFFSKNPSNGNVAKTSEETPRRPPKRPDLTIQSAPPSKPSNLSYGPPSPSPSQRKPFVPTGARLQQSKPRELGKAPQNAARTPSESEEEDDDMSESPTSSKFGPSPIFSTTSTQWSCTTSATSVSGSGSVLPSPKFTRKKTLEYGDSISAPTPLKRTRTSENANASGDSVSSGPSPKSRRTSSEHGPRHIIPDVENNVFLAVPKPNASSSKKSVDKKPANSTLSTCFIAHSAAAQREMDRLGIAWGVQYELARGVTRDRWSWDEVLPKLGQLTGSNLDVAAKVPSIILGSSHLPLTSATIWGELDREQRALLEDHDCRRGLGAYGDFEQESDWYGGRIIQIARIVPSEPGKKNSPLKIQLDSPDYKKSTTRLARYLGSRRVMRLNIAKDVLYSDELNKFLRQKFVLCGRVFVPLRPKDDKVYLVEISENFERKSRRSEGDHLRITFPQLIDWHNPAIEANAKQAMRKWAARFDLILSPSNPVLEFELENIYYIPDEYASSYDPKSGKKAAAEQIVTDGCGYMNRGALSAISKHLGLKDLPTAVQGRIAGAKGVWMLHPDHQHDFTETPRIWIRDSQNKINIPDAQMDRAHRIFDLVASPRVTFPARLSMQTIVNMSHNGVPDEVFIKLMEEGMSGDYEKLTTWTGPNAMKVCLHTVAKAGNVAGMRLQRQTAGMGRALGFVGREKEKEEDDQSLEPDELEAAALSGKHPICMQPFSLGEKIFEMIQAGFHPLESETLNSDLRQLLKTTLDSYVKSYHIPNSQSCEAFIVPDPFGKLDENEIYFRASQNIKDPQADCNPELLTGPLLLNRNPTRLPSDIQLVTAVDRYHDVYQNYRDVIICSTKGDCSLASKLAGGDYDGDTAMLTWMPEIVSTFRPSALNVMPSDFLEKNFKKNVETLAEFKQRVASLPEEERDYQFHDVFLLGVGDSLVGLYSRMHENAIYQYGYGHPITVRIGHMFNIILDSVKSGLQVLPEVLKRDKLALDRAAPDFMPKTTNGLDGKNQVKFRRADKTPYILETLHKHGEKLYEGFLKKYDNIATKPRSGGDQDLKSVFENARARAKEINGAEVFSAALELVEKHVNDTYKRWPGLWATHSPSKKTPGKSSKKDDGATIELNRLRKRYAEAIPGTEILELFGDHSVDRLKASYAFTKGSTEKFAHAVAFRDLCLIKAQAKSKEKDCKPAAIIDEFAEILGIPASFVRLWTQT